MPFEKIIIDVNTINLKKNGFCICTMVTEGEALQMLVFGSILSSAFDREWQQHLETVAGGSLKCYKSCAKPG